MADSSDFTEGQENHQEQSGSQDPLSSIKRDLEGWKEVLLPLNRLINWDKPYYPGIIVGITTLIFAMIWYFEPSVLTTFSLLALCMTLIDFLVPIIGPNVLGSKNWTGVEERKYEEICIRLHNFRYHFSELKDTMVCLKNERPKVYFIVVMGFLFLFAWVGSRVDNLFLTYLILNIAFLMPGLRRHSVVQQYLNKVGRVFKSLAKSKTKSQ